MVEKNKKEKAMMSGLPLPEEVVLSSILPLLSMKDVARSSLVSHTWLRYWRNTPILSFHDPDLHTNILEAVRVSCSYSHVLSEARPRFIAWVNKVLSNHVGCKVEEFKLAFYLEKTHQVDIDRWVVWALSKHVQTLILDFTRTYRRCGEEKYYYVLRRKLFRESCTLCLTTLCLKCVNVDTRSLHCLLRACSSTLQDLCIMKSQLLTSIGEVELPSLKCLMIVACLKLETIDIKAPKLVSLTYKLGWSSILKVFHIGNACKLSYVHIFIRDEEAFLFVVPWLFEYFSQLEILKLGWHASRTTNPIPAKFPVLANLKHLEFLVKESGYRTLAAWIPFIGACPLLEKLTLEICAWFVAVPPKNEYREKCPLRCLKTFEIKRFHGPNLDVDIANFVVGNATNLREVIVHPCDALGPVNLERPFADVDFKLPPHVKLVIVK